MALYAARQPIEPRSIRAPLRLEARRSPGHVPGAARHAHGDLLGSGAASTAGHTARAIGAHVRIRLRCRVSRRNRRDRHCSEHRWRPDLGRGRFPGSCATVCVAPCDVVRIAGESTAGQEQAELDRQ